MTKLQGRLSRGSSIGDSTDLSHDPHDFHNLGNHIYVINNLSYGDLTLNLQNPCNDCVIKLLHYL